MIPLRDNQASRRFELINMMLIAANVAVFLHEASLGRGIEGFIYEYAMIPARLTDAIGGGGELARLPYDPSSAPPLRSRPPLPPCSCMGACSTSLATCSTCSSSARPSKRRWGILDSCSSTS